MTVKELRQLRKVLKQTDIGCLAVAEVDSLIETLEREEYVQQVKDFKQHLDKAMPNDPDNDDAWNDFYQQEWSISFGGHTVKVDNCATIYNAMTDFLTEYVQNEL